MNRIEHFRGKLMVGSEVILGRAEGQLRSQAKPNSLWGIWSGYVVIPPEFRERIDHEIRYHLVLTDGRSGDIRLSTPTNDPLGRCTSNFHGTGVVKK